MALLILVKVCVAGMIVAIGMSSTVSDAGYLLARRRLLMRSLLAMYVAVPLAALLVIRVFPPVPAVRGALLVLAVSAGAPLLPRKLINIGNGAYIFSLVVISSLVAIVVVPLWVAVLARAFDVPAPVSTAAIVMVIAKTFLLPLAAGMGLRAAAPKFSEHAADRILGVAGIALAGAGLAILALHWDVLPQIEGPGLLALVLLMAIAVAIGHFLGGPNPDERAALAIACATRHIGIAAVVAMAFPGPRTLVIVAAYVLASALVSIPYLRWRRHVARERARLSV